jgi:hypothetical protein
VTRVIGKREIEIDHANWVPGAIRRQARAVDVSAQNDWTTVRVEIGDRDRFGAEYSTNGFIYAWPIELGAQIIDIAAALRKFQADRSQPTSVALPVVVGPKGVTADHLANGVLPVIIYGGRQAR